MAAITLHGIANCDRCRAARRWLDARGIDYRWHDVRVEGLDAARLEAWQAEAGWEGLLNRRSTTWRALPAADREVRDAAAARRLILAHPTLLRRPLLVHDGGVRIGFDADTWGRALAASGNP